MKKICLFISLIIFCNISNAQYLEEAKIKLDNHNYRNSCELFLKALAISSKDAEINFLTGLSHFYMGKNDLSTSWYDGYWFNKSLEYFSNSLKYGYDSSKVFLYIDTINQIGKKQKTNWINFDNINISKMSTVSLINTNNEIKKINKIIIKPDSIKFEQLSDYYTSLIDLYTWNYTDGKLFSQSDINRCLVKRGELYILNKQKEKGCLDIYNAGYYSYIQNSIFSENCKQWKDNYNKHQLIVYKAELIKEVQLWKKNNPNKIILYMLYGSSKEIVEAYLGKAVMQQYQIKGFGLNRDCFQGNKYSTKDGIYEIAFKSGNVFLIQFTPIKSLIYNEDKLFEGGVFDDECTHFECKGGFFSTTETGNFSSYKYFSIIKNFGNLNTHTTFYSKNGIIKLVSVW